MNGEPSNDLPDSLRQKFPDLRPIKRTPPMTRVNGIGLALYGRRDFDGETRTYVKTLCFSFVFLPILAVAAYRVADADRGWYFIGKERLSSFAKSCNFGVLCLSLLFGGILAEHSYKSSPEYRARKELARADSMLKSGDALEAARTYRGLVAGAFHSEEARRGLRDALDQCLTNDAPQKVGAAFHLLAGMPTRLGATEPVITNAFERGLALVEKFQERKPEAALDLLREVAPLGGRTNAALQTLEIGLLKSVIAADPANTNRVVELALIYDQAGRRNECYQLLTPYREKLGSTEGARLLGQHLLEQLKYEEAYGLLYPYVQARLENLRALEKNFTNTAARLNKRALEDLNAGQADRSFYDSYEKGTPDQKERLVDNYLRKRLQADASYRRALAELEAAGQVVTVTLDLGMVQLNRAQNLADPAARKAELEAAEKTFLAIRGLAGGTDEYRLFLGQVDYWLGKSKEGRELFDELLASSHRSFMVLMQLGKTLRDVGDHAQARAMAEEAYTTAKTNEQKFAAAAFRAHVQKDIDDHIAWLEKADLQESAIQIALNSARGEKALQEGKMPQAAQFLRQAINGYESLPVSPPVLNNWGLACLNLFQASGDIADHDRGLALLERAVTLDPGNSVLLINTMHILFARAIMDVVRDSIHVERLAQDTDTALLAHLYSDEKGQAEIYQRLKDTESMKKALAYLDKGLLLAPKSLGLYRAALHYRSGFKELDELKKLQQRFGIAQIDLTEPRQRELEAYQGAKDKEHLERCLSRIRTLETLLSVPGVKDHPLTLECVNLSLTGQKQSAAIYGAPQDSQQILEAVLAAHAAHPTAASAFAVIAARFFRANDELSRQSPEYADLARLTCRALAPQYLVTLVLERGGALADLAAANQNVRQAIALIKAERALFPSFPRVEFWALLHKTEAAEADVVAQEIRANQVALLSDELGYQFSPVSASAVLEEYWIREMKGDAVAAAKFYEQARADGVPLPPLPSGQTRL